MLLTALVKYFRTVIRIDHPDFKAGGFFVWFGFRFGVFCVYFLVFVCLFVVFGFFPLLIIKH